MADEEAVKGQAAAPEIEDLGAKVEELEAEKARLIEESANYKLGMLKAKAKIREEEFDDEGDERLRRIAREELANSRISQIASEQEALLKKALKENKEMKLAQLNKTGTVASTGAHSESEAVKDTLVTNEQMAAFKAKGWSDKDIERYKKNLVKYGTR